MLTIKFHWPNIGVFETNLKSVVSMFLSVKIFSHLNFFLLAQKFPHFLPVAFFDSNEFFQKVFPLILCIFW